MIGLIFSRDRVMQLDGTLKSFLLHCQDTKEVDLFVIYRATTASLAKQYTLLISKYKKMGHIYFVKEKYFRRDILHLLILHATNKPVGAFSSLVVALGAQLGIINNLLLKLDHESYVLFLVDDNIFVRDFSLHDICQDLESNSDAIGFSLRLGSNTIYCYPSDKPQTIPSFIELDGPKLKFDWTIAEGDFGYPLEISSSVYRLRDVLPLLNQLSFKNPNTLEGRLAGNSSYFQKKKPYLLCYNQSVTFCNPINKVQIVAANRSGSKSDYSSNQLENMFDKGFRINVEAYKGFVPFACHQEVELFFEMSKISNPDQREKC